MEYFDAMCDPDRVVEADFSRKLERERDRYQESADALVDRLGATQERMINAERERDELIHAVHALKAAKGRYHTQQAATNLFNLLP